MNEDTRAPHRQAWDLIPWVVGGTASPAEQQLVAEHAAVCPDCREELAFHTELRAGVRASAPAPHDLEPAWQRMQARLDTAAPVAAPASLAASRPAATEAPRAARAWSARLVRMLAAAVVVQAVGLTVLGAALWQHPRAADYQTLSQLGPAPSAAAIRLVPAADLQQGQLKALLARSGTRMVEVNGDGSLLGLALDPAAGHDVEQALRLLRAEPGVRLAEPMSEAAAARP